MGGDRREGRSGPRQAEETAASFHRIWLAGLGALQSAESEGRELFRKLVERGEEFASKARPTVDRLRDRTVELSAELREGAEKSWDRLERLLDERLGAAMSRLGVPDRDELHRLSARVEELTRKIESLAAARRGGAGPSKRAPRKAAKKTKKTKTKRAAKGAAKKKGSRGAVSAARKTKKPTAGKAARESKSTSSRAGGARKRS